MTSEPNAPGLSPAQINAFITDGFVRIDNAFPRDLAEQAAALLWRDAGCDPADPASWHAPVIRLGHYAQPVFRGTANTQLLHAAFDQLVGPGRWLPPGALGTFVLRFPTPEAPNDDGWHIDVSFGTETPDFLDWRANVVSRGRALLMLFLFTDVGEEDAPTRIRAGSHRDIAQRLAPADEVGLTLRELAADGFAASAHRREVLATGAAGTVYLCHPFLVHAAQPHRGTRPRILAQPPLLPAVPLDPWRADAAPVETAIRDALG
ncbi:phytanoyl-CoA dioxygenase family protein [Sphingomonas sp.]|uniref:phytanoyl-CoA dioxygenase family protein n=1 Tax=Sphingomonas sp. TaxID=28214 RepID=UPI002ED99E91